ncbi:uncharacterized protein [Rutidosis leptorrhynchoides]|uniref:uncharacterized protein n=1 Tax=Rutidosis leptorrhynchoides TaxID=125765 RepID=UPI003A99A055
MDHRTNLSLPDGNKDYVMYCDTSRQGIGYVLMQRNKVIAYGSRQLKVQEQNYTAQDQELGAVVFALKMWRHYPYRTKCTGKTNVMADAFNRKERVKPLRLRALNVTVRAYRTSHIRDAQLEVSKEENIDAKIIKRLDKLFDIKEDGTCYIASCIWANIARYVGKCLTCSKVKVEHQKPSGLFTQPELPSGKGNASRWTSLLTVGSYDTIWVIVDLLTKSAHFLPNKETDKMEELAQVSKKEVFSIHGIPVSIIFDHDSRFTSILWQTLQEALGTRLDLSTGYHPQTDGQNEWTIQTLEDMLRKCLANEDMVISLEELHIYSELHFVEQPVEIMESEFARLKQSNIPIVKLQWSARRGPEFTWEREDI